MTELKKKNTEFHSYQHKLNRRFKVIIKNLHHSTDEEELLEEIRTHGQEAISYQRFTQSNKNPVTNVYCEIKTKSQ
jgi:hypothetical protein